MGELKHLEVIREGAVVRVFLNRPEIHNAFNARLIEEVHDTFVALDQDESVRVIVLGGRGRSFCAGADLSWMRGAADYTEEENHADALRLGGLFRTVAECSKPVIGRVHGAAIRGGTGLVASCDISLATARARFAFSEVRLGLAPAVISPFVVARIGAARARELFITGARFDGHRAESIGLVNEVFEDEAGLDCAVDATIVNILKSPPSAVAACKRLASTVGSLPADEVGGVTASLIASLRASPEGREGMTAFLEGRPASWVAREESE